MATGFTNECNVITIFPLGVTCVGTNPSCQTGTDGSIFLLITGGTPPYNVTWFDGDKTFIKQNMSSGVYSASVTDYYGDYVVDVNCILRAPNDVPCIGPSLIPDVEFGDVSSDVENIETQIVSPILSIDPIPQLTLDYSVNQPICSCDGNITLIADGGYPPYTFSINGNLTSKTFPFFEDLCSGNYYLSVYDSSGNSATNFVVLNQPSDPTTYTILLNTFSNVIQDNGITKIVSYTNTFSVTPSLPDNTNITFDLIHNNILQSSPYENSASVNCSSIFSKNGSGVTISVSAQTTGSTVNTIDGCQNKTIYFTSFTESWNQVQLNSTDTLSLTTQTILTKIEDITCYFGDASDTFSIANVFINGCGCCNVRTISP